MSHPRLAVGNYGEIEQRVRNLTDQSGEIPLALGQVVQPVMIVGDATLPGMPQWRGKAWWFGGVSTIPQTTQWLFATSACWVEQINVSSLAGSVGTISYFGPRDAGPGATGVADQPSLLEGANTSIEGGPMLFRQGVSGLSGAGLIVWNVGVATYTFNTRIYMPAGASLGFLGSGAAAVWRFGVSGRVF